MRNRLASIGIVCLMVVGGFVGLITYESDVVSAGTILYVGGTGGGNYTHIQWAIENASVGDAVYVYNGTYYENVVVNKSIALIGEDMNITIIDGGGIGDVINVSVDFVIISGFTITNSGPMGGDAGIEVYSCSDNVIIDNNVTSNNNDGIYLSSSSNITIADNTCNSNNENDINLWNSSNNTITDNICLSDGWAGILLSENCNNNTLIDNICGNVSTYGFHLFDSSNNTIVNNTCNQNFLAGILLDPLSNNNTLENNSFSNADRGIRLFSSSNNTLVNNNCSNNVYGIYLDISSGNDIINNSCSYNSYGIYLDSSLNNTINNNTCFGNDFGIKLEFASSNNTITNNTCSSNSQTGINLTFSYNNKIYHNNIIDNAFQAYDDGVNFWNDTYPSGGNYWSDWSPITDDFYNGSVTPQTTGSPDGICDIQYDIDGDSVDYYPLKNPFDLSPPTITNFQPPNTSIINDDTPTIGADYNDLSGINVSTVILKVDGLDVTSSSTVTASNVIYTPISALAEGSHTVCLEVKDICGNLATASWSFNIDATPPTLASISPTGLDVPVTNNISIKFNETMNQSSAEAAFSINPSVSGSISWTDNNMTFTPFSNLALNTTYTVNVTATAKDLADNTLDGNNNGASEGSPIDDYSWQFTTQNGHIVLAEFFTGTWCIFDPPASEQLKSIYDSGDHQFLFVSLITDVSDDAEDRADEYGPIQYPTVEFDGGFEEHTGSQNNDSTYRQSIINCSLRTPLNVTLTTEAYDMGKPVIDIGLHVLNNDGFTYDGLLRTYITEISSRYNDKDGNPYRFGILDNITIPVNIPAYSWYNDTIRWDGSLHQDKFANDFGDIEPDNIMILTALFNNPTGLLDQAASATLQNITPPLSPPSDLEVIISVSDIVLQWDHVIGASSYRVYESTDRFAPFASWNYLGEVPERTYTHIGAASDGQTHYYIVRAFNGTESENSTMGVKLHLSFIYTPGTNINWVSIPHISGYDMTSEIAAELTNTKITSISSWDPPTQTVAAYAYVGGIGWLGKDNGVAPATWDYVGIGFYINVVSNFDWVVTGIDTSSPIVFDYDPLGENAYWINLPVTSIYASASDITDELGSSNITEVAKWDAASQSFVRYYWDAAQWTDTDFTINPGDGILIVAAADFEWTPELITPVV